LSIRKELCKSKYDLIASDSNCLIADLKNDEAKLQDINKKIAIKEASVKILKKEIVSETFIEYLNYFFDGKYTFNTENFSIVFNGQAIDSNTPKILSDGEKTVVAFCYFLAETHTIINKDDDYKNLFFIIDDPISSLDFHYVYYIAEILRKLNLKYKMERNRFIVFTHNMEFMSILIRNKITSSNYSIVGTEIKPVKESMVMPYEQHLRDVYRVSKKLDAPSYHTPNSIRHVIETINSFESPGAGTTTFFKNNEELKKNEFVFSLINDCSHGIIRNQKAYTDDMVIAGCVSLVEYIDKNYKGQIKRIESN
jgi:wobble nucleotide-excising tRNase